RLSTIAACHSTSTAAGSATRSSSCAARSMTPTRARSARRGTTMPSACCRCSPRSAVPLMPARRRPIDRRRGRATAPASPAERKPGLGSPQLVHLARLELVDQPTFLGHLRHERFLVKFGPVPRQRTGRLVLHDPERPQVELWRSWRIVTTLSSQPSPRRTRRGQGLTSRSSVALTRPVTTIDIEALKRKYAEERDKRLRPDGNDQYLRLEGTLAHYLDDPYVPFVEREPLFDHVTFAFVGGGFAGLVTGARLREAGIEDVRIIEKGGDVGGTWYWNRYPGAMCDTASLVYMPLLEETGHMPSEKYAHGPEILEHCQRIAKQYGLYDNALFHTTVTELEWDGARSVWII